MLNYDTLIPYHEVEYSGIQYSNCVEYSHISRYRNLRRVIHNASEIPDRFVSLETPNPIHSNMEVVYYTVRASEDDRLDLIAYKYLGSAEYSWILAYINGIDDGFTVKEGQKLKIPASRSVISMLNVGEMLEPINVLNLNLGAE